MMNKATVKIKALNDWQLNAGATEEAINREASSLGLSLPSDYLEFLRHNNGGEGYAGDNYLIIWRIEELTQFNQEYEVREYAPGLLLFGSSGGGEGYAFDMRDESFPIVRVPFIGMSLQYAMPVASNFYELLTRLSES